MLKLLRHTLLLAILITGTLQLSAQNAMPDKVSIGTTRHYRVAGSPGSVFTWKINGEVQSSVTNVLEIAWQTEGTFTVEVQEHDQNNCSSDIKTGLVTVVALTVVTAPTQVCIGSSASLTPTIGGTWISNNTAIATVTDAGLITGISEGSVTFTYTNTTTGFSSTTSAVTVNALPEISTQPSIDPQTICYMGAPIALSVIATAGSGTISNYQWYRNISSSNSTGTIISGANSNSYTPQTFSTGGLYYYVTVTNSNGCKAKSNVSGLVTTTPCADLSINKIVDNANPLVGDHVTFTIIAANNGPSDATGVRINDLLPAGYTYISSSSSIGSFDGITGVWNIGSLTNGVSTTLTIVAKVNP
jgi:uncharacterized repeat protein (TIGR01451 family)